ncbi:MAG: hypothetical protein AB9Q19_00220 [Candidatus Reddybacter sp.]
MDLKTKSSPLPAAYRGLARGLLAYSVKWAVILDRNESLPQETAKTLDATAITSDVANEYRVISAFEKIQTELGPVRVLLNALVSTSSTRLPAARVFTASTTSSTCSTSTLPAPLACARVAAK